MKFGPVPVGEAAGALLAHSLMAGDKRLKKGRLLTERDVAALSGAGLDEITVARFDPDDVPEDTAAQRIASALVPEAASIGITLAAPFTGRANLYAATAGVLTLDNEVVAALNEIDEALTLATLPPFARVTARQMIGTVKIIPYAIPERSVVEAEKLLAGVSALRVHPISIRRASLILTRTPGMADKLVGKGAQAIRTRLTALGITDVEERVVPHRTEALAEALAGATGEAVLILTGSATSDRSDVGPAALAVAGGQLTRFGMPVDPGNLLFLGTLGSRPVVGLPGCARSPKLNGADWVLERIACGLSVDGRDIASMGVGGLLKEIPSRPEPRDGGSTAPSRPRIAAIVLAAGQSRRMRGRNKLTEEIDGTPLLRRVVERLSQSQVDTITCVLAADSDVTDALAGAGVSTIINPRAAEGMGTSIAAGIAALGAEVDAAVLVMGDMPDIAPGDIDRLAAAFDPGEGRAIVRATSADGRPGHPVLFGRRFFEALRGLDGDQGARAIVAEHPDWLVDVALSGESALTDLDTPEAWARWRAG